MSRAITTALSLGQLLRKFGASDPAECPGLVYPVLMPGTGGKPITFCGNGVNIALWTPGKAGRYRDWTASGCPDGFSPAEWRARYRAGATTPLPRPEPGLLTEVWWMGAVGWIPTRWVQELAQFDTCYLAGSGKPVHGVWEWCSFMASWENRVFRGVVRGAIHGMGRESNPPASGQMRKSRKKTHE